MAEVYAHSLRGQDNEAVRKLEEFQRASLRLGRADKPVSEILDSGSARYDALLRRSRAISRPPLGNATLAACFATPRQSMGRHCKEFKPARAAQSKGRVQ
jgi:hypothetical protein